jgi:hypothetical protein
VTPRKRVFTRARVVAWAIALALGIAWALLLAHATGDLEPIGGLLLTIGGIFGTLVGVLIATGLLVRVMRPLGNPTRAMSTSPGELAPDLAFGVCVILFFAPSLFV